MTEIDLTKINKILFIMMGGIGNMIFLTPALNAIREALPNSAKNLLSNQRRIGELRGKLNS